MRASWFAVLIALATACGVPPSGFPYAKEPDPRGVEYVLGPSDEVNIRVWSVPEVSGNARIRPDGAITVQLIGDVRAAGRTPSELTAEIQKRLKAYIKDESAVVSIAVVGANSYRIVVSGRVNQPGVLHADHYLTINEAVTLAGGPTPFARSRRAVLIRSRPNGSVVRIPIRYDLVASGLSPEQNLLLQSGDQIYIP